MMTYISILLFIVFLITLFGADLFYLNNILQRTSEQNYTKK